jgi:hypothetical protein
VNAKQCRGNQTQFDVVYGLDSTGGDCCSDRRSSVVGRRLTVLPGHFGAAFVLMRQIRQVMEGRTMFCLAHLGGCGRLPP